MVLHAIGFRALAVALLVLAGCGGGGPAAESIDEPALSRRSVEVDGRQRAYRLFTPPAVGDNRPRPLVLALHGANNTPDSFAESSQLDKAAAAGRFVVAYPEAERLLWNGGFCCTSGRGSTATDVKFLDSVITDIASVSTIDLARVYAVGMSAGGIMAYRLACDLAGRIAGVGAVGASMQLDDCRPSRPVPIVAIHGTGDQLVPYEGGRINGAAIRPAPPTVAVAEWWASHDRCAGSGHAEVEGIVTSTSWTACADGAQVRLVTLDGGGHNWFAKDYGLPNGAIDATAWVLDFLGLLPRS